MDVPETGAVFAYGRSHLTISGDGRDNNYFFIKKDPVKKLVCGRSQSAVICESGRVFVWGENPCGQLAIGTCENIVTKPSCVKHIKKLGQRVKDFQFGSNFSILLTESNKVFYAGKNVFPFNAKIESLDGKLQHDITELPIELEEFNEFDENFTNIRAGDEHFVLVNEERDKLFGWGFNSHHQLAMIDSEKVLSAPDVFYTAEDDEKIKFMECGKLSTCVVTEFNDLFMVGKFGFMTISTFTKIREPIANSTITQLCISDDDEIFLVTEDGLVYKSNDFRNIIDLRFEQLNISGIKEKILKVACGMNFLSIQTESGKCYSLLSTNGTLVESGKLRDLRAIDVCSGTQHVLVATVPRGEDINGNVESMLNKTYTINVEGMGNGVENYQFSLDQTPISCEDMAAQSADKTSLIDLDDIIRLNESRATTLECKDDSSEDKLTPEHNESTTIKFIDEGRIRNGSVKMLIEDSTTTTTEMTDDDDKIIQRKKTPMPRVRRAAKVTVSDEDLDENGIIDRDEDVYRNDDDDDVSSSTVQGSSDSLEEYIQEESRINAENLKDNVTQEKMTLWKQFKTEMREMKEMSKGLSCKNADNVLNDDLDNVNTKHHSTPCSLM